MNQNPFLLRLTMIAILIAVGLLPVNVHSRPASDFHPAGELRELSIDDGTADCTLGPPTPLKGKPGFGWVNKLTPPSYPATIRSLTIGFARVSPIGHEVKPEALYRIVVFRDSESDGPDNNQVPDAAFIGRVRGTDYQDMTFNLVNPITIDEGSFVVGAIDEFGIADLPAIFDAPGKSDPPGNDAFMTLNGGAFWQKITDAVTPTPFCPGGSFLVRATVELGAVDPLTVTKIKDPAAVEPWGVSFAGGMVTVTNLVSDNVTIIDPRDNSFRNVTITDPRLCPRCGPPLGPFGSAGSIDGTKIYVTLFGTNTIPSKEFPTDYSSLQSGRVAVLSRQSNGSFIQTSLIAVGNGPQFPAVLGRKLYVPCAGANRVDIIDTTTDSKTGEIAVGQNPSSCTLSLRGEKLYVTNFGDGTITVINTATDHKIKDIPAPHIPLPVPVGAMGPPSDPIASNPWKASVSPLNGDLYVTYWGTSDNSFPNGVIAQFDPCTDLFARAQIDDTMRGTPPGSAGASGIPAPTAPLSPDPATGKTIEAGGGGGGPFGISSCLPNALVHSPAATVFTNDARGVIGIIDTRIDQVVTSPAIALMECPKARGVVCASVDIATPGATTPPVPTHLAFVACGQPENAVLVFKVPVLPENIPNVPVITSATKDNTVRLTGTGFVVGNRAFPSSRLDVVSPECLTFNRDPKFKKGGRVMVQKGALSNGEKASAADILRLMNPDGSARLIIFPTVAPLARR